MPLLHKKPFTPELPPQDLKPDEEVFVCKATQEIFRDYEKFFNRHFLCNSYVWTCSLTGQSNLTYIQAAESERDAQELLSSFQQCYQRAVLELVHHARRTNIRSLGDELLVFFKERYVTGERLELTQTTSSGAKVLRQVVVVNVITPDPTSPVRVSVISLPPSNTHTSPMPSLNESPTHNGVGTSHTSSPSHQLTNGLSESPPSGDNYKHSFKTPKSVTSRTPLTPQISLQPSGYIYIVETMEEPATRLTVSNKQLSRSKGQLNPKKLKLFLRNALERTSEKHHFKVKEEYVQRFSLGVSSVPDVPLPSPSLSSRSRKRTLSQASLDSFLTPNGEVKRSRPASLDTSKHKKGKKHSKSRRKSSSKSKTPSSSSLSLSLGGTKHKQQTPKSRKRPTSTPRSPKSKTPRSHTEALKVLNKAKRFRQMDLKKSVIMKSGLNQEELDEMQHRADEERRKWKEVWEEEKKKKREERLEKLRAIAERKRLERLRQREIMKPREDTLCKDNKPLPQPGTIPSELPQEVFGEAVMVLEFLHSFGPLFNIREVIRGGVTFGKNKLERCLLRSDTDTILFDVMRFLIQAVFAVMSEDHEDIVSSQQAVKIQGANGEEGEMVGSEGSVRGKDEEVDEVEREEEEDKDVIVESIRKSSMMFAQLSQKTQRLPLSQLVVDPYTCSEVLRLHLLASGGYSDTSSRKRFRSYKRGGYTDADNPAIALRLRRPDMLTTLSRMSIYDLSPQDKLEILSTLCGQLLTFTVTREHIEESSIQCKRVRRKMRELQYYEERRKREHKAKEKKEKLKKLNFKENATDGGNTITAGEQKSDGMVVGDMEGCNEGGSVGEKERDSTEGCEGERDVVRREGEDETEGPQETEEERRERIKSEIADLQEEMTEVMCSVNLQPLGVDRYHRKYWLFPNLPGLYVEDMGLSNNISPPSQLTHSHNTQSLISPHVIPDDSDHTSYDITSSPQHVQSVNSDLSPQSPTHPVNTLASTEDSSNGNVTSKWSCYTTADDIEELIDTLDVRGVREKALKESIILHKKQLFNKLGVQRGPKICRSSPTTRPQCLHYDSGEQYLELYLRELILDTEERIHLGNLGHLRGNQTRDEWRDCIENSGAAAELITPGDKDQVTESEGAAAELITPGDKDQVTESEGGVDKEKTMEVPSENKKPFSSSPTSQVNPSVHMLAQALLDMEGSIEQKFLMPPLGNAIDKKTNRLRNSKKITSVKETDVCREQWRLSLSQSTSFSQVYLHLATLERCIMWSRSLMNVRCRICRRKGGDEYMLLCDGCDHGYHTYCLKPPLETVPDGDWYCHDCNPVTPVKPRSRTQRVTFQEVESSDSEEAREEGESEVGDYEEDDEEEEEVSEDDEVITNVRSRRGGRGQRRSSRLQKKSKPKQVKKVTKQKTKKTSSATPSIKSKRKLNMESTREINPLPTTRAESIVSAIIELRCSRGPRGAGATRREQRGLEMQLCEALLEEINNQECSWPFAEPVKKKEYPDYHDVVAEPMDLLTIRSKIKRGDYSNLDGLVADMELLFSNCQQFHRRHSEIGKAGVALRRYFDKRCSDLGLKDLELVGGATSRTRLRSSGRKK